VLLWQRPIPSAQGPRRAVMRSPHACGPPEAGRRPQRRDVPLVVSLGDGKLTGR